MTYFRVPGFRVLEALLTWINIFFNFCAKFDDFSKRKKTKGRSNNLISKKDDSTRTIVRVAFLYSSVLRLIVDFVALIFHLEIYFEMSKVRHGICEIKKKEVQEYKVRFPIGLLILQGGWRRGN